MDEQIYITIAKVLHGEASDAERRDVGAWVQSDKGNAAIFDEMKRAWADADALFDEPKFDTTAAWAKVSAKIQAPAADKEPARGRVIAFPSWLRYSSAVAAILLIALLVWNPFGSSDIRVVADNGNRVVELPDHSRVTLRKGSSLSYPKAFDGATRAVALEGEAFFDVARDERHPFVVDAQAVSVTVLGTSFNVSSSTRGATVSVATGRVRVSDPRDTAKSVILLPGNTADFENGAFRQRASSGAEMYWMTRKLQFNNEPLEQVVAAIAAAEAVELSLDADMPQAQRQQPVTASFQDQSLEDMLTELCLITNTRFENRGGGYAIRAK